MKFGGFEKFTLIDYPGKIACMVYTIGCNFACPYCHNPELVRETAEVTWDEEEVLDFLEERSGLLEGVVITGGEPTLHAELPEFLRKVKEMRYLVKLDTNGTNPKMLEKIIEEKLADYIAMDIKSPLSNYNKTVGRPVDVGAVKKSIEIIMHSGIDYEFRTTVLKALHPPEDIQTMGREIKGAKKYYLQTFMGNKLLNPQFREKATYSDSELQKFKELLEKNVEYCAIR